MLTTEDIQTLKIDFYKLRNNKLGVAKYENSISNKSARNNKKC